MIRHRGASPRSICHDPDPSRSCCCDRTATCGRAGGDLVSWARLAAGRAAVVGGRRVRVSPGVEGGRAAGAARDGCWGRGTGARVSAGAAMGASLGAGAGVAGAAPGPTAPGSGAAGFICCRLSNSPPSVGALPSPACGGAGVPLLSAQAGPPISISATTTVITAPTREQEGGAPTASCPETCDTCDPDTANCSAATGGILPARRMPAQEICGTTSDLGPAGGPCRGHTGKSAGEPLRLCRHCLKAAIIRPFGDLITGIQVTIDAQIINQKHGMI